MRLTDFVLQIMANWITGYLKKQPLVLYFSCLAGIWGNLEAQRQKHQNPNWTISARLPRFQA